MRSIVSPFSHSATPKLHVTPKGFHFREIQRLNGLPQILGHLNCLGEVAGQKQTKLFAAKSADRALRYRFYRRAEFGQHNVSGLVPMHVIDAFEPVHIK